MAKNKKYYWLKLKDDFFDDETIRYIEEQENGILYVNFYLKMCLRSLKTSGRLIRLVGEMLIPYDVNSLSRLTNTDIKTVTSAMELFKEIGLIKILGTGELYLSQIEEMIGNETENAVTMRRMRAKNSTTDNNVTKTDNNVITLLDRDRDKEIEIRDKDIDICSASQNNKPTRHKYGEYKNVLLSDEELEKLKTEFPADWEERIERLSCYIASKGAKYKNHLATIRNWARKDIEKGDISNEQNKRVAESAKCEYGTTY